MKKSLLLIIPALSLLFVSCEKDGPTPQGPDFVWDSNLEVPEYHTIITNGCDPGFKAVKTVSFPKTLKLTTSNAEKSWQDIGIDLATEAAKAIGGKVGDEVVSQLKNYLFGPDPTTEAFNEILGQLAEINAKMDQLLAIAEETLKKLDEVEYNQMHDGFYRFRQDLTAITLHNSNYYNKMSLDMDEEQLKALVQEWGNATLLGNPACIVFNYVAESLRTFTYAYNGKDRNLFAVYDMIVYHTTPFAAVGFDTRDIFRGSLAAELIRTGILASLYYYFDGNEPSMQAVDNCMDWVVTYFTTKGNPVNRDLKKVVCQIAGAQFTLAEDALEEHCSWTGSKWVDSDGTVFSVGNLSSSPDPAKVKDSQLTAAEINLIAEYFSGQGHGEDYSLFDCLGSVGLIPPEGYSPTLTWGDCFGDPAVIGYHPKYNLLVQESSAYATMSQGGGKNLTLCNFLAANFPIDVIYYTGGLDWFSRYGRKPRITEWQYGVSMDVGDKDREEWPYVYYKSWKLTGSDPTCHFPGDKMFAFKVGSLVRYDWYDDVDW